MNRLSMESAEHKQELLAYIRRFVNGQRLQRLEQVLDMRTRYISVVLENIFQAQNASAVLRSCECFGIQDVHIIEHHNPFEVNPEVAMGSDKWLSLTNYNEPGRDNTKECLQQLKARGYRIIATSPDKEGYTLESLPLDQKTALIFGTELNGISDQAKQMADGYLHIPMRGFTESFNISVSVAICLYHLVTKMQTDVRHWQLSDQEKTALMLEWVKKSVRNPEGIIQHYLNQVRKQNEV